LVLLAQAEQGENFQVSGIYERDRRLLEFLEQRGIRPGAKIHVAHRNYDHTLTLTTGVGRVSLGISAAEKVWVKPDGKAAAKVVK
jgi:Fe2+ transport system protein FeoA